MTDKNEEYVKPPTNDKYVKPPKRDEYVTPPNNRNVEYHENNHQNSKENNYEKVEDNNYEEKDYVDPYDNPSYFQTPKVGFKFYINSYLIFWIIFVIADRNLLSYSEPSGIVKTILLLGYGLLSNYTYSWYADYKRYVGGRFAWFFRPYGCVKIASASSLSMDYHTGDAKMDWAGNTKVKYKRDLSKTFLTFIIIFFVTELLKFYVALVIAFITLFTHKRTIRKYNRAVDMNTNY
ncbi:MAG: hypothetical protein Q4B36_06795 [Tissierellia bacterium]|nr:hypothetical protein [Tissierellia bacterium]